MAKTTADGRPVWVVLGIHGAEVKTVVGNVARVRMFVTDDLMVDEDFALPTLPKGVPETAEIYEAFLETTIDERLVALQSLKVAGKLRAGVKPESLIHGAGAESVK